MAFRRFSAYSSVTAQFVPSFIPANTATATTSAAFSTSRVKRGANSSSAVTNNATESSKISTHMYNTYPSPPSSSHPSSSFSSSFSSSIRNRPSLPHQPMPTRTPTEELLSYDHARQPTPNYWFNAVSPKEAASLLCLGADEAEAENGRSPLSSLSNTCTTGGPSVHALTKIRASDGGVQQQQQWRQHYHNSNGSTASSSASSSSSSTTTRVPSGHSRRMMYTISASSAAYNARNALNKSGNGNGGCEGAKKSEQLQYHRRSLPFSVEPQSSTGYWML